MGVPADTRPRVWPLLLGVWPQLRAPDPLRTWTGAKDLPNQAALRADCQALFPKLAADVATSRRYSPAAPPSLPQDVNPPASPSPPTPPSSSSASVSPAVGAADVDADGAFATPTAAGKSGPPIHLNADDTELLLTFYCKSRSVPYTSELLHLLAPLLQLGLPRGAVFSCFYAFCRDYVPRLFHSPTTLPPKLSAAALARQAHLLRLLLSHYDPKLASHLDNIRPNWHSATSREGALPTSWMQLLMAGAVPPSVLQQLWDVLLVRGPVDTTPLALAFGAVRSKRGAF